MPMPHAAWATIMCMGVEPVSVTVPLDNGGVNGHGMLRSRTSGC